MRDCSTRWKGPELSSGKLLRLKRRLPRISVSHWSLRSGKSWRSCSSYWPRVKYNWSCSSAQSKRQNNKWAKNLINLRKILRNWGKSNLFKPNWKLNSENLRSLKGYTNLYSRKLSNAKVFLRKLVLRVLSEISSIPSLPGSRRIIMPWRARWRRSLKTDTRPFGSKSSSSWNKVKSKHKFSMRV